MNAVVKASVALAVLVAIMSVALTVTGLHKNPIVGGIGGVFLAIIFNVGAVFYGLKATASENGYGKQVLNGLWIGVIAGVLIFLASYVMLTTVFPNYLAEVKQANIEMVTAAGLPEEQLRPQIERIEAATVTGQSLAGMIGTLVTSVISAAIIAIFKRKK